jgi:hypothetical protein
MANHQSKPDSATSPELGEDVLIAMAQCVAAIEASDERLASVVRRLPGWTEGSSTPAVAIDFLASEYGWTLEHIAGLGNRQMIAFIEAALRRRAGKATADEEWLPASAAVERAEQSGHTITLKWLTRDAAKHGVKIRRRQLPGRHKVEAEWNSIAGYLLRPTRSEEEPDEESDEEAISSRLRKEAEQKRRERSLD